MRLNWKMLWCALSFSLLLTSPRASYGLFRPIFPLKWDSTVFETGGISLALSDELFARFLRGRRGHRPNLFEEMMLAWNDEAAVEGWTLFQIPAPVVSNREYADWRDYVNDDEMGVYIHNQWFPDLDPNILAITIFGQVTHNAFHAGMAWGQITHVDIVINGRYAKLKARPTFFGQAHDLRTVILHELGHVLGLPDIGRGDPNSVMFGRPNQKDYKWTPTRQDATALKEHYQVIELRAN